MADSSANRPPPWLRQRRPRTRGGAGVGHATALGRNNVLQGRSAIEAPRNIAPQQSRRNPLLQFEPSATGFPAMAQEIERRFLVRDVRILDGRRGEPIIQGYLAKEVGSMSTRVRIRGERAFLTLKSPKQGFSRDEFEYPIPVDDAHQMIARHCAGRVVRKTLPGRPRPPRVRGRCLPGPSRRPRGRRGRTAARGNPALPAALDRRRDHPRLALRQLHPSPNRPPCSTVRRTTHRARPPVVVAPRSLPAAHWNIGRSGRSDENPGLLTPPRPAPTRPPAVRPARNSPPRRRAGGRTDSLDLLAAELPERRLLFGMLHPSATVRRPTLCAMRRIASTMAASWRLWRARRRSCGRS